MTTDRRLLAGALGFALLVAACGGSSTGTSAPAASSGGGQSAAPGTQAPAATQAPVDTQAPQDTSAPTMPAISLAPGSAGDLEAMIPATVGSITFQKSSFDGASIPLAGTPIDQANLDPLLAKYGKTIADIRFAIGIGTGGSTATVPTMVYALQIKGVPATEFMAEVAGGSDSGTAATVGGKTVTQTSVGGFSIVLYPKGDVLFMVSSSAADADAILAALP